MKALRVNILLITLIITTCDQVMSEEEQREWKKSEETISSSSSEQEAEGSDTDSGSFGRENTSDPFVLQMYFFEDKFKEGLETLGREASGKYSLEMFSAYNLSQECLIGFGFLIDALNDFEPWALRMLDSSSKIPEGIMYGSISSFGNYDECLDTVGIHEESKEVYFKGQYCAVNYYPVAPASFDPGYLKKELPKAYMFRKLLKQFPTVQISIGLQIARTRFGYCFPSTCSRDDVQKLGIFLSKNFHVNGSVDWCETKESIKKIDTTQAVLIFIISFYTGTVFVISIVDRYIWSPNHGMESREKSYPDACVTIQILSCFSIQRHYQTIMRTDAFDDRYRFLYGFRFVSFLWILYAYTYIYQHILSVGNTIKLRNLPQQFAFQIFMNGTLAAETFFFMSGFIVSLFTFKMLDGAVVRDTNGKALGGANGGERIGKSLNFITFYLSRIWRQVPVILFAISILIVWPLVGSGPIWSETIGYFANQCRVNWIQTALFFSNFEKYENMCVFHSWYISLDMQLYLIAPILTLLLFRWPLIGLVISVLVITASMIGTAVQTVIKGYPPVPIFQIRSMDFVKVLEDYLVNLFFKPMVHVTAYVMAIITAFILTRYSSISWPRIVIILGWVSSIILKISVLFTVYPWNKGDIVPTVTVSALYGATCRAIWSITIAWDIIACVSGHGGLLTKFLGWGPFIPLARLTFSTYLMAPLIMMATAASNRAPYHFTHFLMFQKFMAFIPMSYFISFGVAMMIEYPFISLERLASQRLASPKLASPKVFRERANTTDKYSIGNARSVRKQSYNETTIFSDANHNHSADHHHSYENERHLYQHSQVQSLFNHISKLPSIKNRINSGTPKLGTVSQVFSFDRDEL